MSKGTRKIKCLGKEVKPDEYYIHPITLALGKNKNNVEICPSEIYFDKDSTGNYKTKTVAKPDKKLSERDVQTFMALPYLRLDPNQVLYIYKIKNVDDIVNFATKSINEKKEYETINRIINVWIRENLDDLKENNNILEKLYKILGKHFNKDFDLSKISKWIKNINYDDFNLDLGEYILL